MPSVGQEAQAGPGGGPIAHVGGPIPCVSPAWAALDLQPYLVSSAHFSPPVLSGINNPGGRSARLFLSSEFKSRAHPLVNGLNSPIYYP